jgi:hypothetical protein
VFQITSGPGEVNAWSQVRLPFQPKGEMLEFRQRLDAAIRAMPPAGAGHLVATYTAADPDTLVDTENVLFYNVGLGCFAAHTRGGLAFERVFAAPPERPAPASWTPRHHHCYRATPLLAGFERWRPVRVVAQWGDVPLGPGALAYREMVWAALAHVDTLAELDGPVGYYAIRIRLEGVKVAVANVVKPLIDGVVSSLHCFAGEIPDLVIERLSSSTTTDPGDVRRRLTDRRRAALGARPNLIRLTKNDIAFNPRDEDCVACVIEVAGGNQPRMTGTVFSVEPQEPAG